MAKLSKSSVLDINNKKEGYLVALTNCQTIHFISIISLEAMSKDKGLENTNFQSGFGERFTKAAQSIQRVSENVGKTIASTKELLVDKDLRKYSII